MKLTLSLLAFFILLTILCHAQSSHVIKAGKLIDTQTGTIRENVFIAVENGKIKSVSSSVPQGNVTIIDLSDAYVMPGMIDVHTHMCQACPSRKGFAPGFNGYGNSFLSYAINVPTAYRAILGVVNAKAMVETGFTSIRDIGNSGNFADIELKKAIDQNLVPGPTMITCGKIIAPKSAQFSSGINVENIALGEREYFYADTKDELKKAIRENIAYGADFIKIVVDDQKFIYSVEDIRFIVEEARLAGLKVAAHCVTENGARNAAEASVASIEHGVIMSDEVLQLTKKNNVFLVGVDFSKEYWASYGLSDPVINFLYQTGIDRLKRSIKANVKLAYGSDIIMDVEGLNRGQECLNMIDTYVDQKISPVLILQMLTINAAELMGIEKQRGTIKEGYFADIIAMKKNPVQNLNALKEVSFVMKNGEIIKK